MITEGLKNVAQGLRDKFSGGNVSSFVRNSRNATREMSIFNRSGKWRNKDEANAKLFGAKKKVPGKVGSVETAIYTKIAAGQTPKLKNKDSIADVAAKLLNFLTKTERDRKLHFELFNNFKKEHLDEDKERHEELVKALEKRRLQTEKIEEETQEAKKQYEKSKEEADKVIKEAKDKASKESADKEASEKAAKEAKDKAAKEAKDKAEKEASEKAAKEAKDKAAKEAKDKAEKEAKDKATKDKTKTEPVTGTATPAPVSPANVPSISTKGPTTTPAGPTTPAIPGRSTGTTTPAAGATTTPAAGATTTPAIPARPTGTTTGSAKPAEPVTQASPSVTPAPRTSITPSTATKVGIGLTGITGALIGKESLAANIAKYESTASSGKSFGGDEYNAYNKGTKDNKIIPADKPIDFSQMSIAEYLRRGSLKVGDPDRLFAIGRYQIVPNTMRETIKRLNIDPNTTYLTQTTQNMLFSKGLIEAKRKDVQDYISGKTSGEEAKNKAIMSLSQEFASIGVPYNTTRIDKIKDKDGNIKEVVVKLPKGSSYYAGQGGNVAHNSPEEVGAALDADRLKNIKNKPVEITNTPTTGSNLNQSSVQNNNMKQSERNTILIDNTQTTIISKSKGKAPPVITQGNTPDAPMFQQLGY
jgi:hypothetical protein